MKAKWKVLDKGPALCSTRPTLSYHCLNLLTHQQDLHSPQLLWLLQDCLCPVPVWNTSKDKLWKWKTRTQWKDCSTLQVLIQINCDSWFNLENWVNHVKIIVKIWRILMILDARWSVKISVKVNILFRVWFMSSWCTFHTFALHCTIFSSYWLKFCCI